MPLLVPLVGAWIAGLLAGATASPNLLPPSVRALVAWGALGVGVVAVLVATVRPVGGDAPRAVVGAPERWLPWVVLGAGVATGWSHRAARAQCLHRAEAQLARGGAMGVLVDADVRAPRAGPATATVEAASGARACAVPVQLAVPATRGLAMQAGTRWLVRGRARRLGDRLRLDATHAEPVPHAAPEPLRAWRGHLGRFLDRAFGEQASLARALLVADQRDIPPAVRDRFADAGLVHLLSVSGTHVAIIAGALATLGGALRLAPGAVTAVSLALVALYVALLGAPPPAVRSAVMLAVDALALRCQRPLHPWTALALGAAIPTVDPGVVIDLGWQLSVAGMAALVAARALLRPRPAVARRAAAGRWRRWRRRLVQLRGVRRTLLLEAATGVVAGVVTAPLVAWTFGRLSVVAPVANLAAMPVIAVLQPALFLTVLCAPAPWLASWVADATGVLLRLLDATARLSAAIPGGVVAVAPSGVEAAALGVAVGAAVVATGVRRPTPWWRGALAALGVALWAPLIPVGSGLLEIHVLDVGQGDALALRTPHGRWVLVDAGRRWDGGDAGRRVVIPHIRRLGGEVALFILSHPHEDHAGGAATVVDALHPARWWEPAFVTASPGYALALAAVERRGIPWERVTPGRRWMVDGVSLTVLAPDSGWTRRQRDANETSVVVRVDYGARRVLLTGDAEREEEGWLLRQAGCEALRADLLKVGHHGSRTSTTAPFLAAVAPRAAVVSVGAGNRYGHPAPDVLARLGAAGVPVWRTDVDGTLVVRTDGRTLEVESSGGRWRLPPDGGPPRPACPA